MYIYLQICKVGLGLLISFPKRFQEHHLHFLDQRPEEYFIVLFPMQSKSKELLESSLVLLKTKTKAPSCLS